MTSHIEIPKNKMVAPLLRWAGSKKQIINRLISYWKPTYRRYVEPFAGSAVLFFALNPPKALLSDLNKELIEMYEVLKKHPKELYNQVSVIPKNKKTYIKMRGVKVSCLSKFDRAVRFIYLNRLCFNGIFRTNKKGEFNVPFASVKTGSIPSLERFCNCAESLRNAEIRSWDFGKTLSSIEKDDFVYLDPPYAVQNRKIFCEYGPKIFGKEDLIRLSDGLEKINLKGATFLVSYADCKEARIFFKRWRMKRIKVRRNIAGFASNRKHAYELLVTNRN